MTSFPDKTSTRLVVFSKWTIQMEEVALFSVFHVFLEEKHEFPLLERLQPLIPAHLFQLLPTIAWKIEGEYTQMVTMLCAWYSRRNGLSLLRPVLDHFWILRRERLPRGILVLVRVIDPLRTQRGRRQFTGVLLQELPLFRREILCLNLVVC